MCGCEVMKMHAFTAATTVSVVELDVIVEGVRADVLSRAGQIVIVAVEDATNGQVDIAEEERAEQEAADDAILGASLSGQDPVEVMVVPEFADELSPLEDTLLLRGVYGATITQGQLQISRVRITVGTRCLVLHKVEVAHGSQLGLESILIAAEQLKEVVLLARLLLKVPLVNTILPASEIFGLINHCFSFKD